MDGNVSITIQEFSEFSDEVLDIGVYGGTAVTLVLGSISLTGLIIKGIFIYYINYAAPKERPINNMVFFDQVSKYFTRKKENLASTLVF